MQNGRTKSDPHSMKGNAVKKQHLVYVGVFLLGVVLAGKVRSLPVLDKLPAV